MVQRMNKRPRTSIGQAVVNVWQRELGQLSTRNFAHRLGGSQDLVLRLDLHRKLEKHRGCVNTVSFNAWGEILVSGSDDRRVILWDWESGRMNLNFHSGHNNNVFQAKIMPYSDDRSIVTCAADGQVRHAQILERGRVETKLLGKHQGRAHKLAIEPGSPHIFYTCGEDGLVQHFDLRTGISTKLFSCEPIYDRRSYMPIIHLNAIAIDPRNPNLFAVAGSDEFTRLFDIRKYKWDASSYVGQPTNYYCPKHLIGDGQVGITGLAYSERSELLVSYNDELIYLFTPDMGLGGNPSVPKYPMSDNESSDMGDDDLMGTAPPYMNADEVLTPQVYMGHRNRETVKGVNFCGPNCEYVVSGSDCGRIFIWKKKGGELIRVMEADNHVVNCIESHPHTMVLASSGIENDIKIWTPKALERATLPDKIEQVLSEIPHQIRWVSFDWDYDEDSEDEDDDEDEDEDEDDNDDDEDSCDDSIDGGDGGSNDDVVGGNGGVGGEDDNKEGDDNFIGGFHDATDDCDLNFVCSTETQG